MKSKKIILLIIFLITLLFRLFFVFQTPEFSEDQAYFTLRQIENIKQTGQHISYDELSFGGKEQINPPFFFYFLSFFDIFLPINLVAKIIPNIFASLLIFIVYGIARTLTKDENVSLFAAFISGFIPIFVSKTINSISPYTLIIPLIFYMIYCLLRINDKKYIYYFIIASFFSAIISASSFLIIITMFFFLILIRLEKLKLTRIEIELILFVIFLITLIEFFIYKQAFLIHGVSLIWQNIPTSVLNNFFSELNILQAIYQIGIIPFLCGIYITYNYLFRKKSKNIYLLISFLITVALLLWLKLINLNLGLIFLGVVLVLLFSRFLKSFLNYLNRTKFSNYKTLFFIVIFIIFFLSSIIPSYYYSLDELENSPSKEKINALLWLKTNAPNSKILATFEEGNIISYFTNNKNVFDTNFLLVKDINNIVGDIQTIYTTIFETEAIKLMQKYNTNYLFFSNKAKKEYNINEISYIPSNCFEKIYSDGIEIYKLNCKLEEFDVR